MSDTKHTPGPWTCDLARMRDGEPIFGFSVKAGGKVPYVASAGVAPANHALIVHGDFRHVVSTGFTEEEVEANAHLIAAAPDMYEAIQAYLAWGPKTNSDRYLLEQKFLRVIAKAEGRNQ